ncbi:MAG: phytanoyl-CoA dioxygenase family protein [Burkholderiales bacterium]|nr:phytanoyl-CoA dioxygenase family protein [Burkholderiales bacterium]
MLREKISEWLLKTVTRVANEPDEGRFRNPLPGMPIVESPFYEELAVSLPPEIRAVADALHRDGYAVIRFPDADIDARAQRIRESLHDRYDWDGWRARGVDMRVQDAWEFDPDVAAIARNEAVRDLLEQLYGRPAWPFQTLNFPVGTQQHYHSDTVHFSSVPERFMCGVWVALEDIHPDAGPLFYYPGSHAWPIYTNDQIGHIDLDKLPWTNQDVYHDLWEKLVEKNKASKETFLARKGDALIWAANLLHGGEPQRDRSRTRLSQVTHYFFDDCVYYTPMQSAPYLGRMLVREHTDIMTGQRRLGGYGGVTLGRIQK